MRCFPVFLWEISFSEITGALKVGLNINLKDCFPRGKAVPGETKVGTNDGIKKSLGEIDKKARQWGTGLKRSVRKAVKSFNAGTLSSKVNPVDPQVMAQTTKFARGKINELNQKVQEQLKNPQGAQSPRASAGSSTGRARLSAHADRLSKASNATPSQTLDASRMKEKKKQVSPHQEDFVNPFYKESANKRPPSTLTKEFVAHFNKVKAETEAGKFKPQAKTQPKRYQTPNNVTHSQQPSRYEHLQMSEAEARRIVDIGVPHDSSDVGDALDLVARARQVLDEIQAQKDRSKLQKKISEALNPGGRNTRVSPVHAIEHQEQKECESILEQKAHNGMTDLAIKELWDKQVSASDRLEELERFAVFDNTRSARMNKITHLLDEMDKIENALNKMEQKHPDFDNNYLSLSNVQLAKQRANLHNKFAKLNLDCNLTRCEGIVARWAYEMESGEKTPQPHRVDRILGQVINAYKQSKNMGYGSDDLAIIKARVGNLAKHFEKIKREI